MTIPYLDPSGADASRHVLGSTFARSPNLLHLLARPVYNLGVATEIRPLLRDYSSNQGFIDFNAVDCNHILGAVCRAGISWGCRDVMFPVYYAGCLRIGIHRTSYHVIYTDQPIVRQADNWYAVHPARDTWPRVIDLELDRPDAIPHKAQATWEMVELVEQRDGVKPVIYSRTGLINQWLSSWTDAMLNSVWWWVAQYLFNGLVEHPGPPTCPARVQRARLIMHQTSGSKPPFPGEVESLEVDWDRWLLGDEAQLNQFVSTNWGGELTDHERIHRIEDAINRLHPGAIP